MKNKGTKRALIFSLLSLLLCVSMLVGTTFAWFTDSVSSMNNVIKSGNLDVELEYSTDGTTWTTVTDDTSIFGEDDLWEPGHTVAVALRVKNAGTLALQYALSTSVYLEKEGTNVYDQQFKLSDYLTVHALTMDTGAIGDALLGHYLSNRAAAGLDEYGFNQDLVVDSFLDAGMSKYTIIRVQMPETVGNEANYKTGTQAPYIRFGINVYATQTPFEYDSFDNQYDSEAAGVSYEKFPVAIVTDNGPVEDLYVESLFGGGLFDENQNEHLRDLNASFTFTAPAGVTPYEDWIADYEVSVITPNGANLPEGAIVMAGQYDFIDPDWQAFYTPEVESGETYRLLSTFGLYMTYADIKTVVGTFDCGVENINAPAGTTMIVALKLYKQDASNNVLDEHTVGLFTYTFN